MVYSSYNQVYENLSTITPEDSFIVPSLLSPEEPWEIQFEGFDQSNTLKLVGSYMEGYTVANIAMSMEDPNAESRVSYHRSTGQVCFIGPYRHGCAVQFLLKVYQTFEDNNFVIAYNAVARRVYQNAKNKGFWPQDGRNQGEYIALVISELCEALEALRTGNGPDDKVPDFRGAETEYGDAIIRLMGLGIGFGHRIPESMIAKMRFNETRAAKHGKAF